MHNIHTYIYIYVHGENSYFMDCLFSLIIYLQLIYIYIYIYIYI